MMDFAVVLLPGLDGTGTLFGPLVAHLPPQLRPIVVAIRRIRHSGTTTCFRSCSKHSPRPCLSRSWASPSRARSHLAAERARVGLRGVILCATFVRNPVPAIAAYLRHLVRGVYVRLTPEIVRSWSLLGRQATPTLRRLSTEATKAVSPDVFAHRVRSVLKIDVRPQLETCRVPILYIRATQDRVVGRRNGDDVIAGSSSAELVELVAPHLVLQEQPEAAAAVVSRFVAALSSNPLPERESLSTIERR
jgi:pimeloyl-ACP methyl ester carboxylesterase